MAYLFAAFRGAAGLHHKHGHMAEEHVGMVRIERIIQETPDTRSFVLQTLSEQISCRSGQFLTFLFTGVTGKELRRSYSFSSSPELGEPLTVTVKRIANGEVSRYFIDRAKEGDILRTIGASGYFVLPEQTGQYHNYVFFAAGSGITPVYSLIKTILHLHTHAKVLLIYSNRTKQNTIFYSKLTALQQAYPEKFRLQMLFSHSRNLLRSRLTPGGVEQFINEHAIVPAESLYYVCGPTDYMRMVAFTLAGAGVPVGQIKREIFHVQQPSVLRAPHDTSAHQVTIIEGDREYRFTVQYPTTILRAAKLHHIHIPYSCEAGQCGTCVAKCLQGQVWMSRNEVLLDEDMKGGSVLTCTGYPVNGDLILRI